MLDDLQVHKFFKKIDVQKTLSNISSLGNTKHRLTDYGHPKLFSQTSMVLGWLCSFYKKKNIKLMSRTYKYMFNGSSNVGTEII